MASAHNAAHSNDDRDFAEIFGLLASDTMYYLTRELVTEQLERTVSRGEAAGVVDEKCRAGLRLIETICKRRQTDSTVAVCQQSLETAQAFCGRGLVVQDDQQLSELRSEAHRCLTVFQEILTSQQLRHQNNVSCDDVTEIDLVSDDDDVFRTAKQVIDVVNDESEDDDVQVIVEVNMGKYMCTDTKQACAAVPTRCACDSRAKMSALTANGLSCNSYGKVGSGLVEDNPVTTRFVSCCDVVNERKRDKGIQPQGSKGIQKGSRTILQSPGRESPVTSQDSARPRRSCLTASRERMRLSQKNLLYDGSTDSEAEMPDDKEVDRDFNLAQDSTPRRRRVVRRGGNARHKTREQQPAEKSASAGPGAEDHQQTGEVCDTPVDSSAEVVEQTAESDVVELANA